MLRSWSITIWSKKTFILVVDVTKSDNVMVVLDGKTIANMRRNATNWPKFRPHRQKSGIRVYER